MHWRLKSLIWQGVTVATAMDQLLNRLTKCSVQATWPCGEPLSAVIIAGNQRRQRHVTASRQKRDERQRLPKKKQTKKQDHNEKKMTTKRDKQQQNGNDDMLTNHKSGGGVYVYMTTPAACCILICPRLRLSLKSTLWVHSDCIAVIQVPLSRSGHHKNRLSLTLPSVPMVTLDHRWGAAVSLGGLLAVNDSILNRRSNALLALWCSLWFIYLFESTADGGVIQRGSSPSAGLPKMNISSGLRAS